MKENETYYVGNLPEILVTASKEPYINKINLWAEKHPEEVFTDNFKSLRKYLNESTWNTIIQELNLPTEDSRWNKIPLLYSDKLRTKVFQREIASNGNFIFDAANSYVHPKTDIGNIGKVTTQLLDPTGLTSWPDLVTNVLDYLKDPSLKQLLNVGLSGFSVLPMIGKVPKLTKILKGIKPNKYLSIANTAEDADIIQNFIPGIKHLTHKVLNATSNNIINPIYKRLSTKVKDVNELQKAINATTTSINATNNVGDVVNGSRGIFKRSSERIQKEKERLEMLKDQLLNEEISWDEYLKLK